MTTHRPRILIVVLDGLRPDLAMSGRMPVLAEFLERACRYSESRCVFPSSTRVNATAIGAGSVPGATGLTVNKLFDPAVFDDRTMHTGRFDDVTRAEAVYGGRFIAVPTLGDTLKANGLEFAVIGSGSAGTTYFVNPRAAANGQIRLCLRDWPSSTPGDVATELLERFGPIAKIGFPSTQRMEQQTTLFLDGVFPARRPDVTLLWYNEPDWVQHHKGLGSVEADAALTVLDEQFARLLDWSRSPGVGDVRIIVASDHGHITARTPVDLKTAFDEAGLEFRPGVDGAPFAGSLGNVGAIWSRDGDSGRLADLVAWLQEQPWCGMQFTRDGLPGTFDRTLTLNDHARSPDLFFSLRSDDGTNAAGIPGGGFFAAVDIPTGGSFHGGPGPWEMKNLLALSGARGAESSVLDLPAGVADIAPTILAILGIAPPPGMTGRVLDEAIGGPEPDKPPTRWNTAVGNYSAGIAAYGGARYFLGGKPVI